MVASAISSWFNQSCNSRHGSVLKLSKFNFDDFLKCPSYFKITLIKSPVGKKSLCDTVECRYQRLFVKFAFSSCGKQDQYRKWLNQVKLMWEVFETTLALISDTHAIMLNGDTCLCISSLLLINICNISFSNTLSLMWKQMDYHGLGWRIV